MRAYGCPYCDWPGHRNPATVRDHIEREHPGEDPDRAEAIPW